MNESVLADVIRPGAGRGLDFVNLDELRKRTGIMPHEALYFAMSEMLCNSLDTDATEIYISIEDNAEFEWLTIRDNGSKKISEADLKFILDFNNKASSKRGFLRVSRGYLGNALKCIFGYSYALAEHRKLPSPEIVVSSHGCEYRIRLCPNKIEDRIESEIQVTQIEDSGENLFKIAFPSPDDFQRINGLVLSVSAFQHIITATSMVNPRRRISFNLWGEKGVMGEPLGSEELRKDTSILWYTPENFRDLFNDFMRVKPTPQLKEFISLFRGLTRKPVIRDILHDLNEATNHDCRDAANMQFVPATPITELTGDNIASLYNAMRSRGKIISKRSLPRVLGVVGEEQFEKIQRANGWERLRYACLIENEKSSRYTYPFIMELAIFDRDKADIEGLKVYQCVNFMASTEDVFSKLFDIKYRLGRVGITPEMPVTVLAHLVSPVLQWLNYGKSGLYE
jgi:hypothetical protein